MSFLVDELNRLARVVRTPEEVDLVQRARNLALNCFGDTMEIRFDLSPMMLMCPQALAIHPSPSHELEPETIKFLINN